MTTPEACARNNIDGQLTACGWAVQDRAAMNLYAGRGVTVSDKSLEDSVSLPDPDILAREIMAELKAALEQFSGIVEELGGEEN